MQELRFVLIIVGAIAIAALLFHGLWTSKKEGKTKFGNKPIGKLEVDDQDLEPTPERNFSPQDDYEIIKKERKEPGFLERDTSIADPLISDPLVADPLIDSYQEPQTSAASNVSPDAAQDMTATAMEPEPTDLPSFSSLSLDDESRAAELNPTVSPIVEPTSELQSQPQEQMVEQEQAIEQEPEVIVLNVHCSGNEPFVGTALFDSMQQNGLIYGEMDIFHRHSDLSGTGKVLFSVANMMHPGTLKHTDAAEFTTKGISFFMTMPCFGDPEQNFNLMLQTVQQIADDLGGNVLDDGRNLITPNRIDNYRAQIQAFKAAHPA